MPRPRALAASTFTAAALAALVLLAGCTPAPPTPIVPTASPSGSGTPEPSASPAPKPTYDPGASAAESKRYFDGVLRRVVRKDSTPGGETIVRALVAAGFSAEALEVTFDRTAVDLEADNIQFAALINGECLVGQVGNVRYRSRVLPLLESGRCLVGKTRPIDFLD